MSRTGIIAGSLGLTLVLGGAALVGVVGVLALYAARPPGLAPPERLRAVAEDHAAAFGACGIGLRTPGQLTLVITTVGGQARRVEIADSDLPHPVATCVADTAASLPWPPGRGAARVPIRLEPWTR